jgi:hypothetical protein
MQWDGDRMQMRSSRAALEQAGRRSTAEFAAMELGLELDRQHSDSLQRWRVSSPDIASRRQQLSCQRQ